MRFFYKICALSLRWGLLAALIFANLGCVSSTASQPDASSTALLPQYTDTSTSQAEQEADFEPLLTATLLPVETATAFLPEDTPTSPLPDVLSQITATPDVNLTWEMIGKVDQNRALSDLRHLVGEMPVCNDNGCYTITNRLTGSEGLQWAKDYVAEELTSLGYTVELRDWSDSEYTDQNMVATKTGALYPDEQVYFLAHLDGVKWEGEEHFQAADDDASGVVDLLELARVLSGYSLSRTVVLFFSTGEEEGSRGSKSYVEQLSPEELDAIRYVVNIDMVGYDENQDGVMELWSGDHAPSLAFTEVMSDTIRAYQFDLEPRLITGCD